MAAPAALLRRSLTYFALVYAAGFLLGTLRALVLAPRLGERWAELLELPLMLVVVLWAARRSVHDLHSRARAVALGGLALALLLAAELVGAALLRDQGPAEFLLDRDPLAGAAFALSLLVFGLAPAWFARRPSSPG